VRINFLKIDRVDLFQAYSAEFLVTDHVQDEITDYYPDQKQVFERALEGLAFVIGLLIIGNRGELDFFGKEPNLGLTSNPVEKLRKIL
jgi:hypothetical protein